MNIWVNTVRREDGSTVVAGWSTRDAARSAAQAAARKMDDNDDNWAKVEDSPTRWEIANVKTAIWVVSEEVPLS